VTAPISAEPMITPTTYRCAGLTGSLLSNVVFLSLFRDLASDLRGGIERMLGPIMFTHWARRRSLPCDRWGGFGLVLVMSLHEESAAQDGRDKYYDSGSHGAKSEHAASQGRVAVRMP
jgi:hypothetical protein